MIRIKKQFIPEAYCLKCSGCCRFREANSVWSPCLLDEEIQDLLDKNIPAVSLSVDKRLLLVADKEGSCFYCPFLKPEGNKCSIYHSRPFECQLYPFLISLKNSKVFLTVDLNCPYVKEKINTPEFKEYTKSLILLLNEPDNLEILRDNPHIIQAYSEVEQVIELDIPR